MIKDAGYPVENYTVQTSDGYLLGLYRIPGSPKNTGKTPTKAVLLMHGLLSSAADYLVMGPSKALGKNCYSRNMILTISSKIHLFFPIYILSPISSFFCE